MGTGPPRPDVELAEAGQIRGSVLDVGCGTGENLLYLAAKGHESWGLDFVPVVIERAKTKAAERGIDARFIVGNALELDKLGRRFDTVIDCGLFHTFADEERPVFVRGLGKSFRPGDCCTSSASPTRSRGPKGRDGFPGRKSGTLSGTDGKSRGSKRPASSRSRDPMGQSSAPAARRHGWPQWNGRETFAVTKPDGAEANFHETADSRRKASRQWRSESWRNPPALDESRGTDLASLMTQPRHALPPIPSSSACGFKASMTNWMCSSKSTPSSSTLLRDDLAVHLGGKCLVFHLLLDALRLPGWRCHRAGPGSRR